MTKIAQTKHAYTTGSGNVPDTITSVKNTPTAPNTTTAIITLWEKKQAMTGDYYRQRIMKMNRTTAWKIAQTRHASTRHSPDTIKSVTNTTTGTRTTMNSDILQQISKKLVLVFKNEKTRK